MNSDDSYQNGSVQNGSYIAEDDDTSPRIQSTSTRHVTFAVVDTSSVEVSPMPRPSLIEMYTSKRWGVTFLSLAVITMSLTLRMCMSMAIVCMVKPRNKNHTSNENQSVLGNSSRKDDEWLVDWDSETQGQVLSAYYYGFPVFCVFGGWAAGKYSGKRVLLIMMIVLSVVSIGIPYAAITSPYLVIILRIIVGLASGGILPCIMQILSKWAPLYERSQIIATATSGQIFGNVVTFAFSGVMCSIPYQNGWPFIFYIFGVCNLLIMVVWTKVLYDHPEDHPRMSKSEIDYIVRGRRDSANVKMPDPPWIKILISPPFWAILSAHISFGFVFTTIGTFLPLYMNDVMKFDAALNGAVSAVPFIGRFFGAVFSGYLADLFFSKAWLSTRCIRILFQTVGMIGSAPFLFGFSYLDDRHKELAVFLLIIYWFLQGASSSGFRVNHIDIAPRFSGVINGMTMTCGSIAAMISPVVTSAVIKDRTQKEWQIVFFICIGVGIMGTVLFDCFAEGEEQEWAQDKEISVVNDTPKEQTNAANATMVTNSQERKASSILHEINGIKNETFLSEDDLNSSSSYLKQECNGNVATETKNVRKGGQTNLKQLGNPPGNEHCLFTYYTAVNASGEILDSTRLQSNDVKYSSKTADINNTSN